jgi:hypothetical protein
MSELSQLRYTVTPNGIATTFIDQEVVIKNANYTLVDFDDAGKVFGSTLDGMEFTMAPSLTGYAVTFVNMAEDGQAELTISPAATEGITWDNSSTADKGLINTKATSKKGDYIKLASLNITGFWQVIEARGIWAKEP